MKETFINVQQSGLISYLVPTKIINSNNTVKKKNLYYSTYNKEKHNEHSRLCSFYSQ